MADAKSTADTTSSKEVLLSDVANIGAQDGLPALRQAIDTIDRELVRLLNVRMNVAASIGKAKELMSGVDTELEDVYQPHREKVVFDKVSRLNQDEHGALTDVAVRAIFREIMSASISLQRRTTVAFLGPKATYTHQAAVSRFGASVVYVECETIADVFLAVQRREASYGIVPVENSTEGSVTFTLDELATMTESKIYAEVVMPIQHNLLSNSPLEKITKVYSHPQALAQCRRWLRDNLKNAELIAVSSTGKAAQMAAVEDGTSAIASPLASSLYDVSVAAPAVQDLQNNQTRFLVLGAKCSKPSGKDKTFLLMSLRDRTGALHDALSVFQQQGVNLLKIESRPNRIRQWEYQFFVDLDGHETDESIRVCLKQLEEYCSSIHVLGSCTVAPPVASAP